MYLYVKFKGPTETFGYKKNWVNGESTVYDIKLCKIDLYQELFAVRVLKNLEEVVGKSFFCPELLGNAKWFFNSLPNSFESQDRH